MADRMRVTSLIGGTSMRESRRFRPLDPGEPTGAAMSIPPDGPQIFDFFDPDVPLRTLKGGDGVGILFEGLRPCHGRTVPSTRRCCWRATPSSTSNEVRHAVP